MACPRDLLLGLCYSLYISMTLWKLPTLILFYMLIISICIFQGKTHETLEKTVNHELKKSITGFVLTNHVSIIPKSVSCSWTTVKISIFQFQLIITQYQSSLKYLSVILDDKLNWKPQIEKLVTQLSKSCGMLFKLKHYTNISVLKSSQVMFAL